ncbi:MAG: ACT domain-containing protein [Firmicutes bacterium]|nr:ACT domain-containing protein [Bacillota bacterium]
MRIRVLAESFVVCQVPDFSEIDFEGGFLFLGKTDEEISLVCETKAVPKNVLKCENGWKALGIVGVLEFSLTGILCKISSILSEAGIGIFAVSTYNTDYILVKEENLEKAVAVLSKNGYDVL